MPIKISATNWMRHASAEIDLEAPIGFLVGANRKGKTALGRDAVEFAFLGTGELRGITTKKDLAAESIRDGADACEVVIETPNVLLRRHMKRDATQRLSIAQREGDDWGDETPLPVGDAASFFPMAEDAVRAILDPTGFFRLPATRRREILIAATSEAAPEADIEAALVKAVTAALGKKTRPAGAAKPEAACKAAAKSVAAEGFRVAEAKAVEKRKAAKREAAKPTPGVPSAEHDGIDLTDSTLQAFEAHLAEIEGQHRSAIAREAAGTGNVQGQLDEAQRQLAELMAKDTGTADADAAPEHAAATAEVDTASTAITALDVRIWEARGLASTAPFERPGTCPHPPLQAAGFACPVKDAVFTKALGDGAERRKAAQATVDELQAERNTAQGNLNAAKTAQAAAKARVDAEAARALLVAEMDEQCDALEARIIELTDQLDTAKADPSAAGTDTAADLQKRVDRGRAIVEAKRAHQAAQEAKSAADAAVATADADVALWDAVAIALKPDGIEATLGGNARTEFQERLGQLQGLTGPIEVDAEFAIRVRDDAESPARHVLSLSESHQRAVGMALQNAIAQLIQFPVLICDAIDLFDGEHRAAWLEAAETIAPAFPGGVLGIATATEEPPGTPPDGAQTFWLKADGSITTLGGEF